jgi:hypothetical protein
MSTMDLDAVSVYYELIHQSFNILKCQKKNCLQFYSSSRVSFSIKWFQFQPPPDHSCGGSNRDHLYQIQHQSLLNQLTIGTKMSILLIIVIKEYKLKY